ncbi:hypothetical protein [Flagellimonas marinaquae]
MSESQLPMAPPVTTPRRRHFSARTDEDNGPYSGVYNFNLDDDQDIRD